jgi:hypothetical protein
MSVVEVTRSGISLKIDVDSKEVITSAKYQIITKNHFSKAYLESFPWFIDQIQGTTVDEALNVSLSDFILDLEVENLEHWPLTHPLIYLFHEAVYGIGNLKGAKILKTVKACDLICFCFALTKEDIELDLKNKIPLKAGTLCNSCNEEVQEISSQYEINNSPLMQTYEVQNKILTYAQMILFLQEEIDEWRENREFFPQVYVANLKFTELTLKSSESNNELRDYFEKKLGLILQLEWVK